MTELWHYFIMAFSKFSHTAGTRSPMYFSCKAMAHRSFLSCTTPWQYRTAFADFHRPKTSHYCHERQLNCNKMSLSHVLYQMCKTLYQYCHYFRICLNCTFAEFFWVRLNLWHSWSMFYRSDIFPVPNQLHQSTKR